MTHPIDTAPSELVRTGQNWLEERVIRNNLSVISMLHWNSRCYHVMDRVWFVTFITPDVRLSPDSDPKAKKTKKTKKKYKNDRNQVVWTLNFEKVYSLKYFLVSFYSPFLLGFYFLLCFFVWFGFFFFFLFSPFQVPHRNFCLRFRILNDPSAWLQCELWQSGSILL